MDRISFDIFEPEKKRFHFTPSLIVMSLWGFEILFFWGFNGVLPVGSKMRNWLLAIVLLVTLFFLITSFFRYEPLRGIMKGKIIFNDKSLVIDGNEYKLSELRDIDFGFIDYFGERPITGGANFNPVLSQGVNNYISFNKSGDSKQVFFRMITKHSSLTLYPFINAAVGSGAMSYDRATDLIGVDNVTKP